VSSLAHVLDCSWALGGCGANWWGRIWVRILFSKTSVGMISIVDATSVVYHHISNL
jgi:hypothetical protein